ncbi:MAG TPA: outer membrane protein assembly factor BamD [Geobacteraceae bacterium]
MPFRTIVCLCLLALLAGCATIRPTPPTPESMFQEGENLFAARHYEDAIAQWKRVKESNAPPELTARAELKIADAQFAHKNYIEAAAAYEDFRKLHPDHEKAPYALYRLGLCHFNQIEKIDIEQTPVKNAVTMFETFLKEYPASEYAADVRAKLENCRDKQLQYEIYVGRFYFRTDKFQAAINRLEGALAQFPKSPRHDETLFYLGAAYLRSGEKAKGEQAFARLATEFPASKYIVEARKLQKKK